MVEQELTALTATAAASLIRKREISSVELVQALLKRIERTDQRVQAWETIDADGALAAARTADALAPETPLHGVPFGLKDIFFSAGIRTTASFKPFADFVPDHDAEAAARLKLAGGILLGKTTTTQFALADPTKTMNPWNPAHTPGGSSSGSGAAVAARQVPFALGTQTAGSVLRPAAFCGVVGFKPSFGLISRRGVFPLAWTLDHVGILCRSVEDAALALQCMAGYDPLDPWSASSLAQDYLGVVRTERPTPPVLGLVRDYLDRAQPPVRAHIEQATQKLMDSGATVKELALPEGLDDILAAQFIIMRTEAAAAHGHMLAKQTDQYGPRLRVALELGRLIPGAAYVHALRIRRQFRTQVDTLMQGVDGLLTPTVGTTAPERSTTGEASFQAPWSMLGLPAISLPSGLSDERLPIGVQLAGRRLHDAQLLSAAAWCERALGPMPAPALD